MPPPQIQGQQGHWRCRGKRSCLAGAPGSLTAPTVVSERRGFERAVDSVKWSPCFIVFVQDQIYSISS